MTATREAPRAHPAHLPARPVDWGRPITPPAHCRPRLGHRRRRVLTAAARVLTGWRDGVAAAEWRMVELARGRRLEERAVLLASSLHAAGGLRHRQSHCACPLVVDLGCGRWRRLFSEHISGEDLEGVTLAAVGQGYQTAACKVTSRVGPDLARGELGSVASWRVPLMRHGLWHVQPRSPGGYGADLEALRLESVGLVHSKRSYTRWHHGWSSTVRTVRSVVAVRSEPSQRTEHACRVF